MPFNFKFYFIEDYLVMVNFSSLLISIYCLYLYKYLTKHRSMLMEEQPGINPITQPNKEGPILIKCSLHNHTPDEIYDYLYNNVGELGMKIKKRIAIIGFEDKRLYDKILTEHKTIQLRGKKLEFKPFLKVNENYLPSDEEDIPFLTKESAQASYPEFRATNKVEARLNSGKLSMMDKTHESFMNLVQVTRERVSQLKLQYRQQGPREREMASLSAAVEKKMKLIESKYEQDVLKLKQFVSQFSMKPLAIDLEPTFKFEETWNFPKISEKNMNFEPDLFFKSNGFPCKRFCAINRQQFAVTSTIDDVKIKSSVKIFDVKESSFKNDMNIQGGAYGIIRLNNYLLIGGYDATIKYVNLGDEDRLIENSKKLSHKMNCTFYDIKILKKAVDNPQILSLSTDSTMRCFEISFEQITEGFYAVSFEEKLSLLVDHCITLQIFNPQVLLLGGQKKLKKFHIEKKITKEIAIADGPIKIKMFNDNICAVAYNRYLEMLDLRSEIVVQRFCTLPQEIKCLQIIGEHSIMIGGKGFIGLLDDRRQRDFPWKSEEHHNARAIVYDILKLENKVVSCDSEGKIYSWKLSDSLGENLTEVSQEGSKLEFRKK